MLVVTVAVNDRVVDRLLVHNTKTTPDDVCIYEAQQISKHGWKKEWTPDIHDIVHRYENDWITLIAEVAIARAVDSGLDHDDLRTLDQARRILDAVSEKKEV